MKETRQNIQYALALEPMGRGETPVAGDQGTEPSWRRQHPKARPQRIN